MKSLAVLGMMLYCIHAASAASHSLKYFYTGVTAGIDFPEFSIVGLVDDGQFMYYDSKLSKVIPKTEWMEKAEDEQYWNGQTQIAHGTQPSFKASIGILMKRFNQTQGVHTWQEMYGCEWDEETGATEGFDQHGYDGEDFIVFDMKNMRWIAPTPQAVITKNKLDKDTALNEDRKNYFTQICIDWLKKYVSYGRSTLERRVPPEVSLFQKDSSSPVVCHATGFFPRGIMVTWQRDGEEMLEDVELGETLPNGDGTFQITSRLTVKPEDWKSHTYNCTVQHKSLEKDIVKTKQDLNKITTHGVGPGGDSDSSDSSMDIIIGCVVVGLILAGVIGVVMWKKKKSEGYGKTNTSDTDSEGSSKPSVTA